MNIEFRVLGPVEAVRMGAPVSLGHARQRCVLAALLTDVGQPVPTDQLMRRVWGEHPPQRGREALYSYLSRLRTILARVPEATLERTAKGYVLKIDDASVDLHRFRHLVRRARATDDDTAATQLFDEALHLWRGMAFAGLDTAWLTSMRSALDAERRAAERDRTDAALRCGLHAELVADLTVQTARDVLDERLAAQLMLALYRAGRPADALQHFHHLRRELAEQLGTDPNPSLRELYQQILTADPELAAPTRAPSGTNVPPRQLPAAAASFTGRVDELAALTAAMDGADGADGAIAIVSGTGGIGKTWLALRWTHQHLDRFPDGQLFVDLRGFSPDSEPLDPLTAVRGFLGALGVDPAHISGELPEYTARYRSQIAGKRMLIMLDNAATADQITPLLPGTPSCTVVVTSRTILTPLLTRHCARLLTLDVLSDLEAHALFVRRLGRARVTAEADVVAELVRLCGRYPLALSIVASRAHAYPRIPLAEFAAELRESALDALDDTDPLSSVPAVLSWSLRGLTTQQHTVFVLLGTSPGPDIGLPAAASLTGLPLHAAQTILRNLAEASLLTRLADDRYTMHDVVRSFAATRASRSLTEGAREAALRRLLDFYSYTAQAADRVLQPHRQLVRLDSSAPIGHLRPPPDAPAALAWFDTEHANLLAAHRMAGNHAWHSTVWQLAWALNTFHLFRGHRHDRLAVWLAALDAATHLPEHAPRIHAYMGAGDAYAALGWHEDGISHLRKGLALAEEHRDFHQQARAHRVLACVWGQQSDFHQAQAHAARALDLARLLGEPVWEANALNQIGWYAARMGEYETAHTYCEAALRLHRHHNDIGGEADDLDSLGYIAHHVGDHRQAIRHYQHAFGLLLQVGDTMGAASALEDLGLPNLAVGQHQQARVVWLRALDLYERMGTVDGTVRVREQLNALGAH